MASDNRYCFIAEWFDTAASLIRTYQMFYYIQDATIEMFDLKNKKLFLRRSEYPKITIKEFFIGSVVTIHSRQLKLVEYGDVFTKKEFESKIGKTFAMIKPDAYINIGKIITAIEENGFQISNIRMCKLNLKDAEEFYAEHKGKPFYDDLTNFVSSDFVIGLELIAENCIERWRSLIGPTNCQVARIEQPKSLRALFGTEGVRNALHGSDSHQSAQRELDLFFSDKSKLKTTAFFKDCTCCVIKPHIVTERKIGRIIDWILTQGFEISAMQMFYLDRQTSEEFFEVYKGILPEFKSMADHFTIGPCIAMEVRQENVVQTFRELCGPHDPEIARNLRPNTIRAKFGTDRVKNAVHCTDLPEDGVLESEYFFTILQQKSA